jgi:hypothetical protein
VHRAFFWLLAVLIPLAWWRYRTVPAAHVLMAAFVLQAALGIKAEFWLNMEMAYRLAKARQRRQKVTS